MAGRWARFVLSFFSSLSFALFGDEVRIDRLGSLPLMGGIHQSLGFGLPFTSLFFTYCPYFFYCLLFKPPQFALGDLITCMLEQRDEFKPACQPACLFPFTLFPLPS